MRYIFVLACIPPDVPPLKQRLSVRGSLNRMACGGDISAHGEHPQNQKGGSQFGWKSRVLIP